MELDEPYRTKKYTGINKEYYEYTVEGMRNAVLGGTCWRLNIPDVEVCAKTGTVQNPHGRDHSSCIAFAPMNKPEVAIAIYVENGGWGGHLAVPIARLMLEKYFYGEIPESNKWQELQMQNWSTLPGSVNYIKKPKEEEENDAG